MLSEEKLQKIELFSGLFWQKNRNLSHCYCFIHVYVGHLCMCMIVCDCVCVCVCVRVCVYVCMYVYVYECVCMSVCLWLWVCACKRISVCVSVCVYHIYVSFLCVFCKYMFFTDEFTLAFTLLLYMHTVLRTYSPYSIQLLKLITCVYKIVVYVRTYKHRYIHVYNINFLTFFYLRTHVHLHTHSAILDILDIVGLCSAECSLQYLDLLIKATKSKEQLLLVRTYVHLFIRQNLNWFVFTTQK